MSKSKYEIEYLVKKYSLFTVEYSSGHKETYERDGSTNSYRRITGDDEENACLISIKPADEAIRKVPGSKLN